MNHDTNPVEQAPTVLRARGLSKDYTDRSGSAIHALTPVDFDIAAGEFVALVGPSGCGKSTLLNLLGGLISPTAGSLSFRDDTISGPRPEIGMMFQAPVLFPWRTVLSNVLLPVDVRRRRRADFTERAESLLALVDLEAFGSTRPS